MACDDKGRCRKLCLFRSQSCRLTREALDLIFTDHFSRNEPGVFETLLDALPTHDYYMHLADLKSYIEADERLLALYTNPYEWARKAMLNVAGSGKFFSDHTIAEDAAEISDIQPCRVSEKA
jgi:glycogen phosphorylase